jgi:glucose-1-phosphate cytidylyltransferase
MKVVLLAGGFGTRISEESHLIPKPMIEIGERPILWHIMKTYSHYGYNEFIVCCGYKQQVIKEWFANYYLHYSDVSFDFSDKNRMTVHNNDSEPWKVTLIDTGLNTMTGGRLKRVQDYIGDETFMLTYGDGMADINVPSLIEFHKQSKRLATLTAVQPPERFGITSINVRDEVDAFVEKPADGGSWINAGYFVLEPQIFDYIQGDSTIWEKEPLENLAKQKQLMAYRHRGFWRPMDTLRDKNMLEDLWQSKQAPWKIWE